VDTIQIGEIKDTRGRALEVALVGGQDPRVGFGYPGWNEMVSVEIDDLLAATGATLKARSDTVGVETTLDLGVDVVRALRLRLELELYGLPAIISGGRRQRLSPLAG
jgi:hypothetical protein